MPRKKILILNGPNLNMLGIREPTIYGRDTLDDIKRLCRDTAKPLMMSIDFKQSNHEGQLVTWIQKARGKADALVLNAGAYTHTSLAIHDALKLIEVPIIEVHLSDPEQRESFRHFSYVGLVAHHVIKGKGAAGYAEALTYLSHIWQKS